MTKIGYLAYIPGYADREEDKLWMKRFGCDDIIEEQPEERRFRLGLDKLLASIGNGDTLVISKLAHVLKGSGQLSFLLEFCRIKGVRLVSLRDGIDSNDDLFPGTGTSDILSVIARLPEDLNAIRKCALRNGRRTKGIKVLSQAAYGRAERHKLVVNMYRSSYTIDDIWKASGFRSRSSIFRVLKDEGVELKRVRGRASGK